MTHQDASSDTSSIPLCSMGLNLRVSGKGTLAVGQKKKKKFIHSTYSLDTQMSIATLYNQALKLLLLRKCNYGYARNKTQHNILL